MKKITFVFFLLMMMFHFEMFSQAGNASATYSAGDIPTDHPFNPTTAAAGSSCSAELVVTIPVDKIITGVDVSYNMTAAADGWFSEQRSRISITNPGGVSESGPSNGYFAGVANTIGTFSYSRTGLTIGEGVTGGGDITFRMDAFRTWRGDTGTDICGTLDNKVDNDSWTITVYYDDPPSCFAPTNLSGIATSADSIEFSWNAGDSETLWDIELVDITAGGSVTGTPTATGVSNPYVATGLTDGNDYAFYVRADCEVDGVSDWAGPLNITLELPPLCATDPFPADGAMDVEVGSTTVSWTPPATGPTPTSYNVYVVENINGDNPSLVANSTTNSLEVEINGFDTTIYWLVLPVNGSAEAESCAVWSFTTQSPPGFCLSAPFGQWPNTAFTPNTCDGETTNTVTTAAWAGEFSLVNVEEGQTYEFSSSVGTDLITISADAGASAASFGTTPVLWTSTITGQVRFYTHLNEQCESQDVSRSRIVKCGASLSVDDFNMSMSEFTFSPNPVKNILTLTAQNNIEQVTVFNMLGQAVIKTAPNRNTAEVDMSNLGSGTYFAQVSVNGIIKTVKVLKD